jgi:signal transduction histidine kinase
MNLREEDFEVVTDINRVKQILLNFLSNSLKFTFKGYVSVTITSTEPNIIEFSIEDTGIGIPE